MADTKISALPAITTVLDADEYIVSRTGTSNKISGLTLRTFVNNPYVYIRDEKAQGVEGGAFTNGAWRTRTLNTKVYDVDNIATLSSNQVTLTAGTYHFVGRFPASGVGRVQARLQNVTDATTIALGSQGAYTLAGTSGAIIHACARFTISGGKALELQMRSEATQGNGWAQGVAGNWGTEIYAEVEFWKIG
jgi:hypothetical protein